MTIITQELNEELKELTQDLLQKMPGEIAEAINNSINELYQSGIQDQAFKKGDKVPLFSLVNTENQMVKFEDILNEGPVVLTFYRGSWSPHCIVTLRALQNIHSYIKELGVNLVVITPESPAHSALTKKNEKLDFEILSDKDNKTAHKFKIAFRLGNQLLRAYDKLGINLVQYNNSLGCDLPIPVTYLIGKDRNIHYSFVEPDHTKRAEPREIINEVLKIKEQLPV